MRLLKTGVYLHFKNRYYMAYSLCEKASDGEVDFVIATHCDTGEDLRLVVADENDETNYADGSECIVLYKSLYGETKFYGRPVNDFLSLVDTIKHPNISQKYRFEFKEDLDITTGVFCYTCGKPLKTDCLATLGKSQSGIVRTFCSDTSECIVAHTISNIFKED